MSTNTAATAPKFGTFLGVYLPSLLTILGLVMYLRFGWVVGNVGLGMTLLIVLMATSITFITGLSASAIATNIQVGVGGEYYLISRSLGLEPGGAIGIPLYLCRTLSVTFYSFGLAEAILILWPESWGILPSYSIQLFAAVIIILVTLLSGRSAALVLKAQVPIMILVALSILALIIGISLKGFRAPEWTPTYRTAPEGFWYVFAVFFPAVTGFAAGIGMSGDLKNPRKSIPRGTIGAVLSGGIVYIIIPLFLSVAAALTVEELADPDAGVSIWTRVALFGSIFIYPAVWGAILSSAFGSILGGPRVLQALSMDGLAPKFLSKLSNNGQPKVATWVSGGIALLAVALGELNTVAKFVSVLFLTLYVAVQLSAAIETLVAEPSYRPKIKVPWYVSLIGALGAIVVMYLISPLACLLAFLLEGALLVFLFTRSLEQQWGDVAAGFWLKLARLSLLKVSQRKIHKRNWRPLMLLFVNDINTRIPQVKLATSLGQNYGVVSVAKLLFKHNSPSLKDKHEAIKTMNQELASHGLQAFCEANIVDDLHSGILYVAKAHGIAGFKTNTIVFGWSEDEQGKVNTLNIIRRLSVSGKNILLIKLQPEAEITFKKIDIWWGGKQRNGDLMLLCAYLLKLNKDSSKAQITIRSIVNSEVEQQQMTEYIKKILPQARIVADVKIQVKSNNSSFTETLHSESKEADLVFLGLKNSEPGEEAAHAEKIDEMFSGLTNCIFVQNNGLEDVVPDLLSSGKI
ncbi:MAG: amino acid permease [Bacteroidetes bacterium]|nr:MAG: amino acid permease [Bacteroidota bacterium]